MSENDRVHTVTLTDKQWHYFLLELAVDPDFVAEQTALYNDIAIDDLTWKTLVGASLKSLHGIRGEACHFDILEKSSSRPQNRAIIRTQHEDRDLLITSLMNYTFRVSSHLGSDYDTNGYLKVNVHSSYLGLLLKDFT